MRQKLIDVAAEVNPGVMYAVRGLHKLRPDFYDPTRVQSALTEAVSLIELAMQCHRRDLL